VNRNEVEDAEAVGRADVLAAAIDIDIDVAPQTHVVAMKGSLAVIVVLTISMGHAKNGWSTVTNSYPWQSRDWDIVIV
jgi:hypothetical protein